MCRSLLSSLILVLTIAGELFAAEFFLVGDLPGGGSQTRPYALSADGSTLVGSAVSEQGQEAFRWTVDEGIVGLGDLLGGAFNSTAFDVSGDGFVIVGRGRAMSFSSPSGVDRAFRWTEDGMVQLTTSEPDSSVHTASRVSRDGNSVYGTLTRRTGPGMFELTEESFRWTQSEGAVSFDFTYPQYEDIRPIGPGDKLLIATDDFPVAMRQFLLIDPSSEEPTVVREFAAQPTNISPPPIGTFGVRLANDNASVAAGTIRTDRGPSSSGIEEPYMELNGVRRVLTFEPSLAVVGEGFVADMTDDGAILLGYAWRTGFGPRPFIWTEAAGIRDLWEFFANDHNLVDDFEGWFPAFFSASALEISSDGSVIAGLGSPPQASVETYVVRLTPRLSGDANFDGCVDLNDFAILKANFGGGVWWNQGNFDGDGDVDLEDFSLLKQNFGAKSASVPEPATLILTGLAAAILVPVIFRRSSRRCR